MALYEYACSSCEHRFERIMKRGARAPRCPECGATTQRQISAPAIHFKGSGWYVTDYARKGKKDGGRDSAENGDSKKKAESKDSSTKTSESKSSDSKASGSKNSGSKDSGSK